jgi:DNA-directed RNA polymerase specialized sigma24 family protein
VNINFAGLSDRDIAEHLYKEYGCKLVNYAINSWQFNEDEAWDVLYDTLYGFIKSYANQMFASEKQVGALVWKIFKNKLRDKLRREKRKENGYQEVSFTGDFMIDNPDSLGEVRPHISDAMLMRENKENPILTKFETLLDGLKDWERQLLICRANDIPYKVVEEMTGKKKDFLKVHYPRLKKRITEILEKNFNIARKKNE